MLRGMCRCTLTRVGDRLNENTFRECSCCVGAIQGAEQPVRELSTQAIPFARSRAPLFRHGYLVLFPPGGGNGVSAPTVMYGFYAYGPDGQYAYQKNIELPGGSQPVVRDVDFDADGNAAVGASALGGPSEFLSGILLLDRTGRETGFIDTGRFTPAKIAIAPDHSIWALGWQRDADKARLTDRQDYGIVRHFSADGKQVRAYSPRPSFPAGLEPGTPAPEVHIEVTQDRVGIIACSGPTSESTEWVELGLNGNVLDRFRIDDTMRAVAFAAFTADDHVYLARPSGAVYILDHALHTWKPIPRQGAGYLMGADGNSLVYRAGKNSEPILLAMVQSTATLMWLID